MGKSKREDQALLQAKKKKEEEKKCKGKNGKKIIKLQNQTKAGATNPEQKVGWTWTDSKGRTAGHTTRWIRWRMIDQAETN
jgi:hypothetical protein